MLDHNVILEPREVAYSSELRPLYASDIDFSQPINLFPKWSETNQRYYLIAAQQYHRNEITGYIPKFWEFVTIYT